jgi:uncharacterized membrane protein YeaQ/YmgE (transglycosylase-associated protein family)
MARIVLCMKRSAEPPAPPSEFHMSLEAIVIILIIGGLAGWLAGLIVKGYGFGLLGNIVIGIIGAFVGTWVLGQFGVRVGPGLIGSVLNATVGAVFILVIIGLIRRVTGR